MKACKKHNKSYAKSYTQSLGKDPPCTAWNNSDIRKKRPHIRSHRPTFPKEVGPHFHGFSFGTKNKNLSLEAKNGLPDFFVEANMMFRI